VTDNPKFLAQVIVLASLFSIEWFFPYFEQQRGKLKHDAINIAVAVINGLIGSLVFSSLIVLVSMYSLQHKLGLLHLIELHWSIRLILAVIVFDLWMYAWHVVNHLVPFFWRFHRMHHSDPAMDVTTGLRFHPGEIVLSFMARLIVVPLLGLHVYELAIYELLSQIVVLFHHSNVRISDDLDKAFRLVFVSPNMHKIHHSELQPETDSNFASFLSVWDRIFGTYRERERYDEIRYGLKEFREAEDLSLTGMIKTPILKK
jgi:sterol desaturase/sphingolipid hydroxylase (fatty acid hydroxylase superfamily)